MSQWIWKFGEFEIYHSMLLHNRRQQYGYAEAPMWKIYAPDPVVRFSKKVVTKGGLFRIYACGSFTTEILKENGEWVKCLGKRENELPAGECTVFIRVANIHTFPCIYVEGVIESNGEWMADDMTQERALVGTYGRFDSPYETPEIFPFSYEKMNPIKQKSVNEGILFDFGKETFAKIHIDLPQKQEPVLVSLGESEEEALDTEWSVIHFKEISANGVLQYPPYAFRYIYVREKEAEVCADYEYLPISVRGKFHCSDEQINRIYDTAVRTFSLNCREFFLDGIKRDRWVWSGDAYQSLYVNHYLFSEPEIEKRTLIALGGKKPVKEHINTIMDYTFFWIMGCMEYYKTYGDIVFLEQIFPQMKEFMDFCLKRTDADGFMRPKEGDWIFIDWGEMDKTGALCAEQVLYAKALQENPKPLLTVLNPEGISYPGKAMLWLIFSCPVMRSKRRRFIKT